MTFDKTKAMRSAERYLSQGKIPSAIEEYKRVVYNDPKDFGTMNMLGDLYVKNSEKQEAVGCFTSVAEHYSLQGFAQKAIAIYNKIAKLEPRSIEVSERLADLYKTRGSYADARKHYQAVADHYQKQGRVVDALAVWKEIAFLDPADTEAFINISNSYLKENRPDEAADALLEAGKRFFAHGSFSKAVECYENSLMHKTDDLRVLRAFVEAKSELGERESANEKLAEISAKFPHNREILALIIDSHLQAENAVEAEAAIISLVEQEPANYAKFLDLTRLYLKLRDAEGAGRSLSMASEHLIVGGQAEEFQSFVNAILEVDEENLQALRLMARYFSWSGDSEALKETFETLAAAANRQGAAEDERYALSQLVKAAPHEMANIERLAEIDAENGFDSSMDTESLFDQKFIRSHDAKPESDIEVIDESENEAGFAFEISDRGAMEMPAPFESTTDPSTSIESLNEMFSEADENLEDLDPTQNGHAVYVDSEEDEEAEDDDSRLQKELDSVKFYIKSGYADMAEKALAELRGEFGGHVEIEKLEAELMLMSTPAADVATSKTIEIEVEPIEEVGTISAGFNIDEFRSEFGLEESEPADENGDYETQYSTAVAYSEMGLTEQAIKEFQNAINLVSPKDGTRRFFQCATLLGHCFIEQGMAKLALTWFERALESTELSSDEKQGVWYEIAHAHEIDGDTENAARYFEQIYAENVNFRDVSERVKNLTVGT